MKQGNVAFAGLVIGIGAAVMACAVEGRETGAVDTDEARIATIASGSASGSTSASGSSSIPPPVKCSELNNGSTLYTQNRPHQDPRSVAICGDSAYVAGADPLSPTRNAYVTRIRLSDGATLWSKTLATTGYETQALGVATDASCNVFITGATAAPEIDFGGGVLAGTSSADPFVVKLAGASGAHLWSRRMQTQSGGYPHAIAVDAKGSVVVTGDWTANEGTINLGNGPITGNGGGDVFVAKYSGSTGAHLWSFSKGGTGGDRADGLAIDASGNVYITGFHQSAMDFGGGSLAGSWGLFLAKFSGLDGGHVFSRSFGAIGGFKGGKSLAIGADGGVYMAGWTTASINFGGGVVVTPGGSSAGFAARFSSVNGDAVWGRTYGNTTAGTWHSADAIAVGPCGRVYVTGYYQGATSFGGPVRTPTSTYEMFVVGLRADGSYLFDRQVSGGSYNFGRSVAANSTHLIAVGHESLSQTGRFVALVP